MAWKGKKEMARKTDAMDYYEGFDEYEEMDEP